MPFKFRGTQLDKAEQDDLLQKTNTPYPAVLTTVGGKKDGSAANVEGRDGYVWYSLWNTWSPAQCLSRGTRNGDRNAGGVPAVAGLAVYVGYRDTQTELEVLGVMQDHFPPSVNYVPEVYQGLQAQIVKRRQLDMLRTSPGGGMTVNISTLEYDFNGLRVFFGGRNGLDLSSNVPGAGLCRWVLIYLDSETSLISALNGDTVPYNPPFISPLKPSTPEGGRPSAYVKVFNGQTEIKETSDRTDIEDARRFLSNEFDFSADTVWTGTFKHQNEIDTTTAFQILDAAGTPIFNVDTVSERVGIGTDSPAFQVELAGSSNVGGILSFLNKDTTINVNDELATIHFRGSDTSTGVVDGAKIVSNATGGWTGANIAPTELQFYTQDNTGSDTMTNPRMTIQQDGILNLTSGFEMTPLADSETLVKILDSSGSNILLLIDSVNARTGIGVFATAPLTKLDVREPNTGGEGVKRPFAVTSKDGGNLQAGDGIGIALYIPAGGSQALGASIDAIRESGVDSNSSTALVFSTSQNDEILDGFARITSEGLFGINETVPLAQFHTQTSGTAIIGQIIRGTAGQTAVMRAVQNSSGQNHIEENLPGATDPHVYFNKLGGSDFIVAGGTEPNLFRVDDGEDAVRIGDWDNNYTQFELDGLQTMVGTARVFRHLVVGVSSVRAGGTAPTDAIVGVFAVKQFSQTVTQSVFFNVHVPTDWALNTDINVHVHWAPTTAAAGSVVWDMDYVCVASNNGELLSAATTPLTVTSSTNSTQDELLETVDMIINGAGCAFEDTIGIQISRDTGDGADTYGAKASLVYIEFEYIADKLGEADR